MWKEEKKYKCKEEWVKRKKKEKQERKKRKEQDNNESIKITKKLIKKKERVTFCF